MPDPKPKPKFDPVQVVNKIIDYAVTVGGQEPGDSVVEVPKERIRAFAGVDRMSARREQKINTELLNRRRGRMNIDGSALVPSGPGPRIISAGEAEFVYEEILEEENIREHMESYHNSQESTRTDDDIFD